MWMEKHRRAMGSIEQREQAMGWMQQTFAAWRKEAHEQAMQNSNMSQRVNTRSNARDAQRQQQEKSHGGEVRKETPTFRDTQRGRRCKDFTDDAGYLRCEWARLRLAMLRNARDKQYTTRPGAPTSAVRPTTSSDYTARRGQMHIQARIGMKLMRIIEGDRDRRVETEDHG